MIFVLSFFPALSDYDIIIKCEQANSIAKIQVKLYEAVNSGLVEKGTFERGFARLDETIWKKKTIWRKSRTTMRTGSTDLQIQVNEGSDEVYLNVDSFPHPANPMYMISRYAFVFKDFIFSPSSNPPFSVNLELTSSAYFNVSSNRWEKNKCRVGLL